MYVIRTKTQNDKGCHIEIIESTTKSLYQNEIVFVNRKQKIFNQFSSMPQHDLQKLTLHEIVIAISDEGGMSSRNVLKLKCGLFVYTGIIFLLLHFILQDQRSFEILSSQVLCFVNTNNVYTQFMCVLCMCVSAGNVEQKSEEC